MPIVGPKELIEKLSNLRGSTFCSIVAVTDPKRSGMKMTESDTGERNPWIEGAGKSAVCYLRKVQRTLVCLNEHYHKGVRRQMEKAGIDPDSWAPGTTWYDQDRREDGTLLPFATGKGNNSNRYLCGRNLRTLDTAIYIDLRTGERIDADEVLRFMPAKKNYSKQVNAGVPEENAVRRQVWDINGIRAMNINGESVEVHPSYVDADPPAVYRVIADQIAEYLNEHEDAKAAMPEDAEAEAVA